MQVSGCVTALIRRKFRPLHNLQTLEMNLPATHHTDAFAQACWLGMGTSARVEMSVSLSGYSNRPAKDNKRISRKH